MWTRSTIKWHASLAGLALLAATLFSWPANAQSYNDPLANPCYNSTDRSLRRYTGGFPIFYNGVDKLAAAPEKVLKLSNEFKGPYKAGCVLMRVTLRERDGKLKPVDYRYLIQSPGRTTDLAPRYIEAAEKVLTELDDFRVLPGNPQRDTTYIIAVPLWEKHAFYNPTAENVVGRNLEHLGYADAVLAGQNKNAVAYHVHSHRNSEFYVVVKDYAEDEPILDFVDSGQKSPYGQPIKEYGPNTMAEFEALIKDHVTVHPYTTITHVEVRYYARNVDFDFQKTPVTVRRAVEPKTHRPVVNPVSIINVYALREGNTSISWSAGEPGRGVDNHILPNTLADIRHAYEEENLSQEEVIRRAKLREAEQQKAREARDNELEGLAAERRAGRRGTDPADPLASYGYKNARMLLVDGNTTYFAAEVQQTNMPTPRRYVVALHDIGENDAVVDLEIKSGGRYEYKASRIRYLQATIMPLVKTVWPDHYRLIMHHHVKGQFVDDSSEFLRGVRPYVTYEQPIFTEDITSPAEPAGLMRPNYVVTNLDLDLLVKFGPNDAVTVADARSYREADRAEKAERLRRRTLSADELSAERRAEVLAAEKARAPGWVYKTERYWSQFDNFYIPSKTFAGEFNAFRINVQFPDHFVRYVSSYSNFCRGHITNGIRRVISWDDVTYRGGVEVSRVRKQTEIWVDRDYFPKFEEYEKLLDAAGLGRIFQIVGNRLTGADQDGSQMLQSIGQMIRNELQQSISWRQFFEDNSCTSATMVQMGQNLLRAAQGQPSLQAAGVPVSNADRESESMIVPRDQMTFFDACYDYNAYEKLEWCRCLATGAENTLSATERQTYTLDFKRFDREALTHPDPLPPASHRFWAMNEFVGACRD